MTATAIKERPILFSGPMVQAILAGRKTQTRRIVKFNHKPWIEPLPHVEYARDGMPIWWDSPPWDQVRQSDYYDHGMPCPYGFPGDRLWVRETWRPILTGIHAGGFDYRADDPSASGVGFMPWRPSIFMPREASRISLEIAAVHVERLQEISASDVEAEGFPTHVAELTFRKCFRDKAERDQRRRECLRDSWDKINGVGSWDSNPWVWCITFMVHVRNPHPAPSGEQP